jgi:serpin B
MVKSTLPLLLSLAVAITACSPASAVTLVSSDAPRVQADPADAGSAGAAITAFGMELYRQVATGDGNVIVSPASIALALGMARAGARGATATEMDAVLHDMATDEHAGWLNALDAALASRTGTFNDEDGKDQPVTLRIANSLFPQRGLTLQDAYLDALASRYGAGVRLVDYQADAEAAREAINAWVAEQTEDRIPELLVPGTITPDVLLTLVNAIYLKAAWRNAFPEAQTRDGPFTRPDGSTVTTSLMHATYGYGYAEGSGWQAVELPYVGGSLAMTVVLPDSLSAFEEGLDAELLDAITDALEPRNVRLAFPRFGIESKVELSDVLVAMGMPSAFNPGAADFSGITTDAALYIAAVIHQANMDVDEKGTTAAAATAIVMRGAAIPGEPVTVTVDRPFLFALRDVPTGTILFLGRVADPTAE